MSVELFSQTDLNKLTVVQLREHLKSRSLPTSGAKSELIERLKESLTNEEKILETEDSISKGDAGSHPTSVAAVEEDVLGDGASPDKTTDNVQVKKDEGKTDVKEGGAQANETSDKQESKEETLDAKTKRALRFGLPLSNEQLKRKRAERFGLDTEGTKQVSDEERKRRRLERFGVAESEAKSGATKLSSDEMLKKRAERFGLQVKETSAVSGTKPSMDGVEKASLEVLEKRAKRFGICSEQAEDEIKKMRRAERFGQQS